MELKEYIINKIHNARIEKNLSKDALGYMIGRNAEYVDCFELGSQEFGILNILKFCEVLNINPIELYSGFKV